MHAMHACKTAPKKSSSSSLGVPANG